MACQCGKPCPRSLSCAAVTEPIATIVESAEALRQAILEKLRTRQWRAGQRLPTERELGRQYGLSRSAVRRVLGDFKRRRLITQTVGSGTYVAEQVQQALAEMAPAAPLAATSPAELMAARLVLEPAIVDMVIGNATAHDFEQMDLCNEQAESAGTPEAFERWDAALHEAIAEAAHNPFVSSVFRLMNDVRASAEWGVLKRRSATPERRAEYQRQHRALVAAFKDRDAERARQLCLQHLVTVRQALLGA